MQKGSREENGKRNKGREGKGGTGRDVGDSRRVREGKGRQGRRTREEEMEENMNRERM